MTTKLESAEKARQIAEWEPDQDTKEQCTDIISRMLRYRWDNPIPSWTNRQPYSSSISISLIREVPENGPWLKYVEVDADGEKHRLEVKEGESWLDLMCSLLDRIKPR